jgi:hypothetical protein
MKNQYFSQNMGGGAYAAAAAPLDPTLCFYVHVGEKPKKVSKGCIPISPNAISPNFFPILPMTNSPFSHFAP